MDWVWVIPIVLSDLSAGPDLPGSQLMKYSPISDCGRDWQNASRWKDPKPVWLIFTVTSAWSGFWQLACGSV